MNHEITGTARRGPVTVEVHPGGALSALTLSDRATALGARTLATTILDAVAEATARANQRTRHALADALTIIGLPTDPDLAERVETTTPPTWRV
ncbi:MAG TPA: YbaB/EbfC family nucleoid-associated protein [Actinophytocola sp.]|uniref:YbaB/EbfC family nucleoid-associated protein n=1 Tax=Actinophytocola sp. TaxID=1872138 RepID=UPI002DDD7A72|nr:YbaB/EbfC family nucleoid-associated protein [Actinophytocola sp.]HEV2782939.1 YbaB/EbfC family nucleoid-associated protein [Actinophytocola sp.]